MMISDTHRAWPHVLCAKARPHRANKKIQL